MEEMMLLTIHGILHLLGYDHATPEQERQMFGLQRQLLLTFFALRQERGRRPSFRRIRRTRSPNGIGSMARDGRSPNND